MRWLQLSPTIVLASLLLLAGCTEAGQTEIARGNVLASQGKLDAAAEAYRAAARAAPTQARPRELLGHVLFDQKRFAEARAAYEEAIQLGGAAAVEAKLGLARVHAEENRLEPAMEILGEVIAAQPQNVYARLSRAHLAMRRGAQGDAQAAAKDAELAIQDTAEAMRVDPKNPSVLYTRGCAFLTAGRPDAAEEAFRLLEEAHPRSPLSAYGKARVAAARNDRAQVLTQLRQARERAQGSPGSWKPEEVRDDPAFRFLKDDPEFQKELAAR